MFKKIFLIAVMLLASICFAAVDVNDANATELASIKGIGAATSSKILTERDKGKFQDWNDLVLRVRGIGEGNASKFSKAGLTVNGESFRRAARSSKARAISVTGQSPNQSKKF